MTIRFLQTPIPASHVFLSKPSTMKMMTELCALSNRFGQSHKIYGCRSHCNLIKAAEKIITEEDTSSYRNVAQIKHDLYAALQGINRGIFGVPSSKKTEIENMVELLESQNPTPEPTLCLQKVAGTWKLIYSTITVLGSKRTKLGLRDFISLGDFVQSINVDEGKAVNVIKFSVKGLNLMSGQLTINASFKITSESRVDINYNNSVITPDQLMNVFRKNYHLLLGIFNPEGWLEITYVDDSLRIGRDDKGYTSHNSLLLFHTNFIWLGLSQPYQSQVWIKKEGRASPH